MIIVGYDPVAGEIVVHPEGEPPVFTATADGLGVTHYRMDGLLCVTLCGQAAKVSHFEADGRPGTLALDAAGEIVTD